MFNKLNVALDLGGDSLKIAYAYQSSNLIRTNPI